MNQGFLVYKIYTGKVQTPIFFQFCVTCSSTEDTSSRLLAMIENIYVIFLCRAEAIYQSMKSTYGVNACHLLQVNSKCANQPEALTEDQSIIPNPWGHFMMKASTYQVIHIVVFYMILVATRALHVII